MTSETEQAPASDGVETDELLALAKAAHAEMPGPWSADIREPHDMVVWAAPNPADATTDPETGEEDHDGSPLVMNIGEPIARVGDVCGSARVCEYIAACSPERIIAILTERDALRDALALQRLTTDNVMAEVTALRARVEAAERLYIEACGERDTLAMHGTEMARDEVLQGFVGWIGSGYNSRGSFPTRLTELSDDCVEYAALALTPSPTPTRTT